MSVTAIRAHPLRGSAIAAVGAAVAAAGVLAATTGVQQRKSVLAQLERPATLPAGQIGPGPANVVVRNGPYSLKIALTPNRAALKNHLAISLKEAGRAVSGARVTVVYSMPTMNMWRAFSSSLPQSGAGHYTAIEPVLGMPGAWQLRIQVVLTSGRSVSATVDDQMRA